MPSALHPATEVPLRIGHYAVTLRASLRVAAALEALPGGIASLWDEIARQKITALHTVIRTAATDRHQAETFLAHAATQPLARFADTAQAACLALLAAVFQPAQGGADPSKTGETMPLPQFFAELYRYGTGWLGWPPSEVWNASVAEIEAAVLAHADRLAKMNPAAHGSGPAQTQKADAAYSKERLRQIEEQGFDPAFDREALHALRAKTRSF